MNSVQLIGRLTRPPEARQAGGYALCELRIAFPKGARGETGYVDVTVRGASAQACTKYLARGDEVAVLGSLDPQEWQDSDGSLHRKMRVKAHTVDFLRKSHREPDSSGADDRDPKIAVVELDAEIAGKQEQDAENERAREIEFVQAKDMA